MSKLTLNQLIDFLKDYGWCYEEISEKCVLTGWAGEHREYPLFIELNEMTVAFNVTPLLSLDIDWLQWPELSVFLLELNSQSQLVKAALNEDGAITLSAYGFIEQCDFDMFSNILGILGYYCDVFYDEIINCLELSGFQNYTKSSLLL